MEPMWARAQSVLPGTSAGRRASREGKARWQWTLQAGTPSHQGAVHTLRRLRVCSSSFTNITAEIRQECLGSACPCPRRTRRKSRRSAPRPRHLTRAAGARTVARSGMVPTGPPRRSAGLAGSRTDPRFATSLEPLREQAHLPAEQPASSQDTRLPVAHADAGRAGDPCGTSRQGPRAPVRLRPEVVLASRHRMRRRQDFEAALHRAAGGRRAGSPLLVGHLAPQAQGGVPHVPVVGLVVSRSVGNAVVRNSVKRRLRVLAAARLHLLPPGSRLVLRAAPAAAGADSVELGEQLDAILHRLLGRAP